MYNFYKQKGQACVPIAIMNGCVYLDKPVPPFDEMVKLAKCEYGGTIAPMSVLQRSGLKWQFSTTEEVLKSQGILAIHHPKYNLHAFFVYNENGKTYFVNSLLTDDIVCSEDEVEYELPSAWYNRMDFKLVL